MALNHYDQASRYAAKLDPAGFVRWAARGLAESVTFQGWLDTRGLPFPGEPDRTCDTVAGLLQQEADTLIWWALLIEFQSDPDPELFGRLLEYLGLLWRERRPTDQPRGPRYEVAALVVNLRGVGRSSRDMQLPGTAIRTLLQVEERNLAEEDAAANLEVIAEGRRPRCILPFIPLMIGGDDAGIIEEWKRVAGVETDERMRGTYGALAKIFADCADRLGVWKRGLEDWTMHVPEIVQEWQTQARVETTRRLLRNLLEGRFGPLPDELRQHIEGIDDPERLDAVFQLAVRVNRLDDLQL